jgi:hypothetical protein
VRDERDDARVVAVVELVSPRNKDRPDARRGFAAKCAAYLQRGIGVVVVDIVTTRQANLHNEMVEALRLEETFRLGDDVSLVALAYRPASRDSQAQVDVWAVPLRVGGTLPVLPLALRGAGPVPLDLEANAAGFEPPQRTERVRWRRGARSLPRRPGPGPGAR